MSHQLSDFQVFQKDATSAVIASTGKTHEIWPINDKVTWIQTCELHWVQLNLTYLIELASLAGKLSSQRVQLDLPATLMESLLLWTQQQQIPDVTLIKDTNIFKKSFTFDRAL